eukprot:4569242-Amphidinium_carterae.1
MFCGSRDNVMIDRLHFNSLVAVITVGMTVLLLLIVQLLVLVEVTVKGTLPDCLFGCSQLSVPPATARPEPLEGRQITMWCHWCAPQERQFHRLGVARVRCYQDALRCYVYASQH